MQWTLASRRSGPGATMTTTRPGCSPPPVNGPLMARPVSRCPAMNHTFDSAHTLTCTFRLERVTGIEPALSAWEAANALWSACPVCSFEQGI
jgi:hypothetical protein